MKFEHLYDKMCVKATVLSSSAKNPLPKEGACKRPCPNCPYRKDKENWLTEAATLLNVSMVHHGKAQYCHMAKGKLYECAGARICLEGGSDTVVDSCELGIREPVASVELSKSAYMRNSPKRKSS
jgi:hypothetical protein